MVPRASCFDYPINSMTARIRSRTAMTKSKSLKSMKFSLQKMLLLRGELNCIQREKPAYAQGRINSYSTGKASRRNDELSNENNNLNSKLLFKNSDGWMGKQGTPKAITGRPSSARHKLSDPFPGRAPKRANRYPVTGEPGPANMDHDHCKQRSRPISAAGSPLRSWRPTVFGFSQRWMTCREAYATGGLRQAPFTRG